MNVFFALTIGLLVYWWILSFIPFLGSVLGVMGAVHGWGWEWWQAGFLFFGNFILILLFGGLELISEKLKQHW